MGVGPLHQSEGQDSDGRHNRRRAFRLGTGQKGKERLRCLPDALQPVIELVIPDVDAFQKLARVGMPDKFDLRQIKADFRVVHFEQLVIIAAHRSLHD